MLPRETGQVSTIPKKKSLFPPGMEPPKKKPGLSTPKISVVPIGLPPVSYDVIPPQQPSQPQKTTTTVQADVYIQQKQQEINTAQQNLNRAKINISQYPPTAKVDILIAQQNINKAQKSLNTFKDQIPDPKYTIIAVEKIGGKEQSASIQSFEYTRWTKEVYGSPGYKQPGVATGVKYGPTNIDIDKELGYASAVINAAFSPEFWQEQLFGKHKGVDVVNKYLYESQNLRNIGFNKKFKTFDPTKALEYTLSRPLISNVVIPTVTGYGLGTGLGALTKAAPAAGAIGKVALTGVGAYYVGEQTIPPAITGFKTGSWAKFQRNILGLGIQIPSMAIGFTKGYNAISKVKIPTLTNRGIPTLEKFNIKVMIPAKTIMNRYNPRNLWVKWGATKIEPETFISKSVLEGKTRFPMSRNVEKTLWSFEKGYNPETGLYETVHARAYGMKEGEITTNPPERATDVYGLYVSSKGEASPYFLRLGSKVPDYGYTPMEISILPKKPTFRTMFVKSITRAPGKTRYGIELFKKWQLGIEPRSTATITPAHEMGLKGEIEAVVPPGAEFKNIFEPKGLVQRLKKYGEYTTFMGREIPIYKYEVTGKGLGEARATKDFFKKAEADYSYMIGSKSIYSPSYLFLSGLTSSFKSITTKITSGLKKSSLTLEKYKTSSYKSSNISSVINSYLPKYTLPSYKPKEYTPSYTPSHIPSRIPSYKPREYTPEYTPPYYPPGYPLFSYKGKGEKNPFKRNRQEEYKFRKALIGLPFSNLPRAGKKWMK